MIVVVQTVVRRALWLSDEEIKRAQEKSDLLPIALADGRAIDEGSIDRALPVRFFVNGLLSGARAEILDVSEIGWHFGWWEKAAKQPSLRLAMAECEREGSFS